jgi:hypothetical protein
MQPLPRPSVTPLPSYCTVKAYRGPSLVDMVRQIIGWLTGRPLKLSLKEQIKAQRVIERLAEELGAEEVGLRPSASIEPAAAKLKRASR